MSGSPQNNNLHSDIEYRCVVETTDYTFGPNWRRISG